MKHFTPENFGDCSIGMLVGRSHLLKDRLLDKHLEPYSVTAAQFKVLLMVRRYGIDMPAELCRVLNLDSGSMTRMLDRLEQKKLILRSRSDVDRRQVQVKLTPEGLALNDLLPSLGAAAMNEFVGALDSQELQQLEHILRKILLAAGDSIVGLKLGEK